MRLSDGHLVRIPHGAVLSQRPSLPPSLFQALGLQAPELKCFITIEFLAPWIYMLSTITGEHSFVL